MRAVASARACARRVVSQSDLQIAQLIYSDSQRTPPGFYEDAAAPSAAYVATFHLKINRRPLSAADLRELSEYLWLFTSYNNFGTVVLKSSGAGTANRLEHTLHLARLQPDASGGCDTIAVLAWTHAADLPAGTLALTQWVLWSFGARASGGITELCTP